MKKTLSLVLALCLILSAACFAAAEDTAVPTATTQSGKTIYLEGAKILEEKEEYTIMAYVPAGAESYVNLLFTEEMEARTNVHINWIEVSPEACTEKVNLALASNELPDAFFKCAISNTIQQRYGEDGVFVPLNDYMDPYMPNFKAALDRFVDLGPSIAMPDGTIYGVPYTNGIPSMGGGPNLWYNAKFYDKLGLTEPNTLEELYDNLIAIRDSDVNGNGEADEIPFLASIGSAVEYIGGAYKLKNRGLSAGNIDAQPDDADKVRFWPATDDYRETLDFVRTLWEENLIDHENNMDIATCIAKYNADRVGMTSQLYTQLDAAGVDFAHITHPLQGPYGDGIAYKSATSYGGGNFVITSACKDPEVLCRWVDYFFSDEGMELFFMGVEGKTFEVQEDGMLKYTEEILNNPDGLSYVQAFGKYLCWGDGRNPAMLSFKYFQGGAETTPQQMSLSEALEPYMCEDIWPGFAMTDEQSKFFSTSGVDIDTKVSEFTAAWVTGNMDNTDENWNQYLEDLNSMGLEQYIEYKQDQLDSYLNG